MVSDAHKFLVDQLVQSGWKTKNFKKETRKAMIKHYEDRYLRAIADSISTEEEDDILCEWVDYVDSLKDFRGVPDAWRHVVEDHDKSDNILVIEVFEVCVTHDLSAFKMQEYDNLWWAMAGSTDFHLRVYRMNRDGTISIVVDAESLVYMEGIANGKNLESIEWMISRRKQNAPKA